MSSSKNLGTVQAIFKGVVPPSNTTMLWYDDNIGIKRLKFYDTNLNSWMLLVPNSYVADRNYVQNFTSTTNVSILATTHILGKYPSIEIVNSSGNVIQASNVNIDASFNITITFLTNTSGKVILN